LEEHTVSIFRAEYGNSTFLQNTGIQPKDYMVQQPRRPPTVLNITVKISNPTNGDNDLC
jgi:hypothetical protein